MAIDPLIVGRRIKHLRELQGRSLGALAGTAEVSKSYLAKLEKGEVDNPGLKTLHGVAVALGLTLNDLLSPDAADASPSVASPIQDYESLLRDLPDTLRSFLKECESQGDPLPADVVKSLGSIQFRGKRPKSIEDWRFVYDALCRSM